MTRDSECLLCGDPFVPVPRHPMVESAWCGGCWTVIAERITLGIGDVWWPGMDRIPAMRSDRV